MQGPIQQVLNTVFQAFQQEGGFGFIPKLAKPMLDALVNFAKKNLAKQAQSQKPGWATGSQEFRKKPSIDESLLINKEGDLDLPEADPEHTHTPSIK